MAVTTPSYRLRSKPGRGRAELKLVRIGGMKIICFATLLVEIQKSFYKMNDISMKI